MKAHIQLILGGARSGKSHYALHQGDEKSFKSRIFLATARALDAEMRRRIQRHRRERGASWRTVEEPYDLIPALTTHARSPQGLVVLDCATLWISNLLCGVGGKGLSDRKTEWLLQKFFQTLPELKGRLRIVSNEVGLGVVPETRLGREFRDLQGHFNQSAALVADQVILMVAGLPQKIK